MSELLRVLNVDIMLGYGYVICIMSTHMWVKREIIANGMQSLLKLLEGYCVNYLGM